jgi:hypothetical protein
LWPIPLTMLTPGLDGRNIANGLRYWFVGGLGNCSGAG